MYLPLKCAKKAWVLRVAVYSVYICRKFDPGYKISAHPHVYRTHELDASKFQ